MSKQRTLTAAAIVAAFVFLVLATLPAQAECDPGSASDAPDCRLSPPQSQQVNPAAVSGDGSTDEVSSSGAPSSAPVGDMPFVSASSLERSGVGDQPSAANSEPAPLDTKSSALSA